MSKDMCKIPIQAAYEIIDGKPVLMSAEYVDIPGDDIARFLIQKFGITPIFTGDVSNNQEISLPQNQSNGRD